VFFTLGLVVLYFIAGADRHMLRLFVIADAVFALAALFSMGTATRYLRSRRMDGDDRSLHDISYEWNREQAHLSTYSPGTDSLGSGGPVVNIDGTPMIQGTGVDVTGSPYGSP
jgi:hypothetical protein